MLKDLLETKKCFKLVLGAGNENLEQIKKLIVLYAKAGCQFFDLCMSEEVAKIAKSAYPEGYYCFSNGIKDDPHTNKALINQDVCTKCGECKEVCIENAINNFIIDEKKCIGCTKCQKACQFNAISLYSKPKDLEETLPKILKYNPDCIELHACSGNEDEINTKWDFINKNFDGFVSLCVDRSLLGDKDVTKQIEQLVKGRKPYTTIIQADGNPMSGGKDDYKTTLQAVAMAEIVEKMKLPVYILVSGGTNTKTKELANLCELDINGVSVGSYARKIVKEYIDRDDFLTNEEVFNKALKIAKELVKSAKG